MTHGRIYSFYLLLIICFMQSFVCPLNAFANEIYTPQLGDILFQDLDCGEFCDAVEAVTDGVKGYDFSHMAIVGGKDKAGYFVYEARSKGVVKSSYNEFINRSLDAQNKPKIIVGRLKSRWQPLIPKALTWIDHRLGKAYDASFDLNNDQYYCSEMIHLAFMDANDGRGVFKIEPMTFVDPMTQKTFPVWQSYFVDLKMQIPEGEMGLNPGGMSRSSKVKIIHNMMKP